MIRYVAPFLLFALFNLNVVFCLSESALPNTSGSSPSVPTSTLGLLTVLVGAHLGQDSIIQSLQFVGDFVLQLRTGNTFGHLSSNPYGLFKVLLTKYLVSSFSTSACQLEYLQP